MNPPIKSTTTGLHPSTREMAVVRPSFTGPRLMGLATLALGAATLIGASQIPSARDGWGVSGPRAVPLAVGVALVVLSLLFLARTLMRRDVDLAVYAAAERARTHWPTPISVLAALIVYAVAMGRLGYALATALFFLVVSWLLGSTDHTRDALVGVLLGVLTSILFGDLLGVRLPVGRFGV